MFLNGDSKPTDHVLATKIMTTLIGLRALPAKIEILPDCWMVSSEKDWLRTEHGPNLTPFHKLLPFPELGPNNHRGEVVLTAFCELLVTADAYGAIWITGDESMLPNSAELLKTVKSGRSIFFKAMTVDHDGPAR
jgi:hypothetical protein